MADEPVNLARALDSIDDFWNPRIATTASGRDLRVVKVKGEFVWHRHDADELFVVVEGELEIALREPEGERVVRLGAMDAFTVREGVEHRPSSPEGASILLFEPTGLLSTGDYTGEVPEHITATTGAPIESTP